MDSHDNFEEEINREIQEGFIKQIADKIVQGMASLENATEDVKRRWIWELLQNAKDVPNRFGGVSVIVELYKDKLEFKHNGDCFTIKNLTSLIQQVSSKDDQGNDPNVTGKFGTGFITTHLLSRVFTIYGVAKSQTNCCKRFKMIVDRDADNSRDMIDKIKDALDELRNLKFKDVFENYEENRTEDDMDTTFEYPLNPETYTYANIGVQDLLKVLPYSLLFIPLVKKVTVFIHTDDGYQKFLVKRQGEINGEGIEEVTIVKEESVFKKDKEVSKKNEDSIFIMNSKGRLNIAWPIKKSDEITKIEKISILLPKLFCSFPLIGSENFYQPMIINSGEFYPNEPRNTIFLRNENTNQVKKNRDLLVQANYLFYDLVKYAINNKFEDFFNLFTNAPVDNPYISHDWIMKAAHKPRIDFLLKQDIVKTVSGTQASIKSMYFPKAANAELRKNLWELYRKYFHDNIVILEELEKWYEVLSSTVYALDIHQFVQKISEAKCLSQMNQFNDDTSRINFLNELINFIKQTEKNDKTTRVSLTNCPIIPNRKGIFTPHKKLLSDKDHPIPEVIKEIYFELTGKSLDDVLIHHSIKMKLNDYQICDTTKTINDINTDLSKLKDKKMKIKISKMMTGIIPIEDSDDDEKNFKNLRLQIIELMKNLEFEITEKPLNDLPMDMWRNSDPIVFDLMLERLITIGKSRSPKPVDLLSRILKKDKKGTMNWMNNYFDFMRKQNFNKPISSPIVPRQDSYFGSLGILSIDDNIPQTIKNILSNGNYDIYSQLIDKDITCFPNQRKMNINAISDVILSQIDMSPPQAQRRGKNIYIPEKKKAEDVYDITIKLICLQSDSGRNDLRKKFFDLLQPIRFIELIPEIQPIEMEEEIISDEILTNLKTCIDKATQFLAKYIIDEFERKGDINSIKNIFRSSNRDESFILQWYIEFIHFMQHSSLFHREFVQKKIYLNQNGRFILNEASVDVDHDEDLLRISQISMFNKDYKGEFIIPQINDVLHEVYHGNEKKIKREDIAKFIDDRIKQYRGNKQDTPFISLILQIRDLFNKSDNYKALFPYTSEQMDQLILNTLNAETLSSIVKIVSEGNTDLLNSLTDINSEDIQNLRTLKEGNVSNTLSTINSLKESDKQYLNDHPNELSDFIRSQRRNAELSEQRRNLDILRQDRLRRIRETNAFYQRRIPNPPVFQRQAIPDIHLFTNFAHQELVHFQPPPPPPKPFLERLNNSMESLLRTVFKKVKMEKPNYFYCKLVDEEEADDYLIIPLIVEKNKGIVLDRNIVEISVDFQDTTIIFIVPNEDNFREKTFKDDIKIIKNIGLDLSDLNIVDSISQLVSIDTDDFSFKGCEKYFVHVKENYINNNMELFDEWGKSFPSQEDDDDDNDKEEDEDNNNDKEDDDKEEDEDNNNDNEDDDDDKDEDNNNNFEYDDDDEDE